MPVGTKRGVEQNFVVSGDHIDTTEEDGIRIVDKVPVVPSATIATDATSIFMMDAGTGTIGAAGGTGSTGVATFTASFTATPTVMGQPGVVGAVAFTGSEGFFRGATAAGSAVFVGTSGTGFVWMAYGAKY